MIILFSCVMQAVTMQDVIQMSLNNSYQLENRKHLIESSKFHRKSLHTLFFPSVSVGYNFGFNAPQNRPLYFQNSVNLTGQVNLFRGMQDIYTYKKTHTAIQIEENALDSNKNDLVLSTKLAYIQILQNKESLKIAKESIKLLEIQLQVTTQFYLHGIGDKSAVLSIEVNLANAKIELARVQVALNYNLEILHKLSGGNFSLDSLEDIEIVDDINFDKAELLQDIYQKNPQFRELSLITQQNLYDMKIAHAQYYPQIDLSGQKYWHFAESSNASIPIAQQTRVQLQASWNFTNNYAAFYQAQSKKANALALNAQYSDLRKDIETEISNLLSSLSVAKQQLSLAKIALTQAEENYRIISNRYQENIVNYIELLNAELLLTNARSSLVNAHYEIATNIARINHFHNQQF